ncbi:hypothetical protein OG453_36940 [Streptomyces sp. NBC_01381]|uniref:hypothetical protein n=1 Tax=Streptomyces sp. NBC_01381 TaxID=2903845 RepID=UPI002255BFB8|nr:hypothetical protein [Streptomyces sp. NBC_01381]MCX4672195.1 hypothetical protein [Streptomyces sp. NBC_01381]
MPPARCVRRSTPGCAGAWPRCPAQIAEAVDGGLLRDGVDPAPEARILPALTGGLASDVLRGQCTADEALALLDHQVGRLVGDV